jgi:hypothetical protein
MQNIQIDGIFTYIDNIKKLKLGDTIKLIPNPKNRLNKDAIGAYTLDLKKIGYIPFNKSQIDINLIYNISHISLNNFKPLLLISVCFPNENIIVTKPIILNNNNNNNNNNEYIKDSLEHFSKYLLNNKIEFEILKIIYNDENFIDLSIDNNIFYTVTKKYYDLNIFKYDEFYKYKLIPTCIYEPYKIHRLENYIKKKYKKIHINKKFNDYISINILNCNEILVNKFIFKNDINIIENNELDNIIINITTENSNNILLSYININNKEIDFYSFLKKNYSNNNKLLNDIKYILLYTITNHEYYNFNIIKNNNNYNCKYYLNLDLNDFYNLYPNIKLGGICYNHKYKLYCNIDLYDDDNIIEILFNDLTNILFINLIIKLIIFNKKIINIYNPFKGCIMKYTLENKEDIINIFNLYY